MVGATFAASAASAPRAVSRPRTHHEDPCRRVSNARLSIMESPEALSTPHRTLSHVTEHPRRALAIHYMDAGAPYAGCKAGSGAPGSHPDREGRGLMPTVAFTQNIQRHVECPTMEVGGTTVGEAMDAVFEKIPRARGYVVGRAWGGTKAYGDFRGWGRRVGPGALDGPGQGGFRNLRDASSFRGLRMSDRLFVANAQGTVSNWEVGLRFLGHRSQGFSRRQREHRRGRHA